MPSAEVRGVFGQALLVNIEELHGEKCCVSYTVGSASHHIDEIDFADLRFAPASRTVQPGQLIVGSTVEVRCLAVEQQSHDEKRATMPELIHKTSESLKLLAWWRASIARRDGDRFEVTLKPRLADQADKKLKESIQPLTNVTRSIKIEEIRFPYDCEFGLNTEEMHKFEAEIPTNLLPFAEAPALHNQILRHLPCNALVAVKRADQSVFLVFYSPDPKISQHIDLLLENHWMSLNTKRNFLRRLHLPVNTANKRIELAAPDIPDEFTDCPIVERFSMKRSFMRFCVGANGKHINMVREMPGIREVKIVDAPVHSYLSKHDPLGWILIFADDKESGRKARAQFDFVRVCFHYPESFAGRLIGRNTNNIMSVIDKTGIIHVNHLRDSAELDPDQTITESIYVRVDDDQDMIICDAYAKPGVPYETFVIEGLRENVDKALLLLKTQMESFREMNKMESQLLNPYHRNLASRLGPMPSTAASLNKPLRIRMMDSPNKSAREEVMTDEMTRRCKVNSEDGTTSPQASNATPIASPKPKVISSNKPTNSIGEGVSKAPTESVDSNGDTRRVIDVSPQKKAPTKGKSPYKKQIDDDDQHVEQNMQARPKPHQQQHNGGGHRHGNYNGTQRQNVPAGNRGHLNR